MGVVYLARDPNLDRRVALKVLDPRRGFSQEAEESLRRRFVLEARAAGNLSHPGIVGIHDAQPESEAGPGFIAMEWVEGESLRTVLQRSGRLPPERAIEIVAQVAEALAYAHAKGMVHRDVKPGNILLDPEGRAKLSDFGIVKHESLSATLPGQLVGSPQYMSPEQIRNEPVDGRSDLFSLGVVLYECLTGEAPFGGPSLASITYKILEIDPRPPGSLVGGLPEPVEAALARCLEKSPSRRFASGRELAGALRTGRLPPPPAAQPAPHPDFGGGAPPAPARAFRLGRLPSVAAAAVAVLAVAALLIWVRPRGGRTDPEREAAEQPGPSSPDSSAADSAPPAGQAAEAPATVPAGQARLEVAYNNRLRSAVLTVWVDGEVSYSQGVRAPPGLLGRVEGRTVLAGVDVPPGRHVIEVRVDGESGRVGAAKSIESVFEAGERRRLTAVLLAPGVLRLSWRDSSR